MMLKSHHPEPTNERTNVALGITPPKATFSVVLRLFMTWALFGIAWPPSIGSHVVAASPQISITIADGVSREDAEYVREAIALARSFQYDALASEIDHDIDVRVLATSEAGEPDVVAYASPDEIVVFTGSAGWTYSSPALRVMYVVHEYVHVVERCWLPETSTPIAMWLIEGMSEYFSGQAVTGIGLIENQDMRDFHRWVIAPDTGDPALDNLEYRAEFYGNAPHSYSLGYLAVDALVSGGPPARLMRFLRAVDEGQNWKTAFAEAFGVTLDEFYRSFAETRADVIAPKNPPPSMDMVKRSESMSPVFIDDAPTSAEVGSQIVVLARTEPDAVCSFSLSRSSAIALLQSTTFADRSGRIFWLTTIPARIKPGPAIVTVNCGGDSETTTVELVDPETPLVTQSYAEAIRGRYWSASAR